MIVQKPRTLTAQSGGERQKRCAVSQRGKLGEITEQNIFNGQKHDMYT